MVYAYALKLLKIRVNVYRIFKMRCMGEVNPYHYKRLFKQITLRSYNFGTRSRASRLNPQFFEECAGATTFSFLA